MKAIFEFDMNDMDDKHDFKVMSSARNMARVLWELQNEVLRPLYKHGLLGDARLTEDQQKVVEYISSRFFELKQEYSVDND